MVKMKLSKAMLGSLKAHQYKCTGSSWAGPLRQCDPVRLILAITSFDLLLNIRESQVPPIELAARRLDGGIEAVPGALAGQFPVGPVTQFRNQRDRPFRIDAQKSWFGFFFG